MGNELSPARGIEAIMRALDKKKRDDQRWEDEQRRYELEADFSKRDRDEFLSHCQPATVLEYTAWMIGYLQGGGEPSHVYDYEFSAPGVVLSGSIGPQGSDLTASAAESDWWVLAEVPEDVPSLYGARSLNILVPNGLGFTPRDVPRTFHGKCGHSTFYFMDGFVVVGSSTPVYTDMLPLLAADL